MAHAPLDPRSPRGILLTTAICGTVLSAAVLAQSAQQRMMVFDDGGGPQLLHFTGPDFHELRLPDFVRRDLPIFFEKLHLDDVQRVIVQVLLDAYLDAFQMLRENSMPDMPGPMMAMGMEAGGGPGGADGESIDRIVRDALRETQGATDVDIDVSASGPVAIAIRAEAGEGVAMDDPELQGGVDGEREIQVWAGTDGQDDEGGAAVMIAVDGPEDFELPPGVREKLEQAAQQLVERLRERLEQAQADGLEPGPEVPQESIEAHRQHLQDMRAAADRFSREKAALKRDFLTEVRSAITAEQLQHWPSFERALTRIKTLPQGRLDGERTDLLTIVEELPLDEGGAEAVAESLEAYEISLDRALVERNEFVRQAPAKMDEAIQAGEFNKALAVVDQAARRRVAVRSVNEQFTETIAAALPAGAAGTFREQVLRRSYPRVYRKTAGQRSFEAAQTLTGLDDETAAAIDAMEQGYTAELDLLNERLRETIHRHQPKETRRSIEGIRDMLQGGGGTMRLGGDDDPVQAALAKRRDLDERYLKQLHALLTPEQVAQLPKPPSKVRRGPMIIEHSGPR